MEVPDRIAAWVPAVLLGSIVLAGVGPLVGRKHGFTVGLLAGTLGFGLPWAVLTAALVIAGAIVPASATMGFAFIPSLIAAGGAMLEGPDDMKVVDHDTERVGMFVMHLGSLTALLGMLVGSLLPIPAERRVLVTFGIVVIAFGVWAFAGRILRARRWVASVAILAIVFAYFLGAAMLWTGRIGPGAAGARIERPLSAAHA